MSAEKNWNKDEMLDIGSVGEDYLDPFGDDEFEQESRQYEEKKATEAKPPKQEKTAQKPVPKQEKAVPNPLEAEIAAAEEKDAETARDGLFSKPPVFSYAGVTEEVEDTSITFEDLRIAKSEDFPELDDGKRVTWTVEYGKISKPISAPKKTEIAKCKSEIEASKEFLDALKKAKDKSPVCKLVPKVTAQSKGAMPQYKGVFSSFDAAEQGGKMISIFPSGDGRVYEMRKTEMGRFITPVSETNAIQKAKEPLNDLLAHISAANFPPNFTKSLGNTTSGIPYVFFSFGEKCIALLCAPKSIRGSFEPVLYRLSL